MRYIIIDNQSGYIVGDTMHTESAIYRVEDPIEACQRISRQRCVGVASLGSRDDGYRVYLANADFIAVMQDRRNHHIIEMIEQECALAASIRSVA
jgi:hypothetical protein